MKLVTAVVCLLSSMAFAQTGVRYDNRVSTVASNVPSNAQAPVLAIPNASVLICNDGACTSPASIFSNQALTVPITGPLTTDGKGMFGFWAAAGSYFYQVSDFKGNLIGTYPITLGGSGSSSSPVGPQYKIGAFNQSPAGGNAALGASNAFTDATGNPLTVPGALSGLQTNSVFNTDLNGGLAPTAALNGISWAIPTGSSEANSPFSYFNGIHSNQYFGHDGRTGLNFYQNWLGNTSFPWSYGFQCTYGVTGITGVNGGSALGGCDSESFSKVGGGVSGDDTWTNFQSHGTTGFYMTRGQSYLHADTLFFGKTGDSIVREANVGFRGAATGFGDEVNKFTSEHLLGQGDVWGTVSVAGANNISAGIASIGVNVTAGALGSSGNENLMDGGYLVFTDEPLTGGPTTITGTSFPFGASGPQLLTTSTTHAVSPWQATLVSDCGAYSHRDAKVNTTCSVNVTVASSVPAAGSVISIADPTGYEQVVVVTPPSAGTGTKSITIKSSLHHYAANSTQFMMGGTAGTVGTFANGLADPTSSQAQFFGWPIAGSPDATHEYVMVNYKQNVVGTKSIILPQLSTQALPATTCASGIVTVAAGGILTAQNFTRVLQGTEAIVIAGSSANNGTITGLTVNADGSASWTAPGGTCGSGSTTGGTLTLTNSQQFFQYCAAETIAITDGAWIQTSLSNQSFFVPSGTLNLDPNTCTMSASERFIQPNRVEGEAQMYGAQFSMPDQTVGANLFSNIIDGGAGLSGQPFIQHNTNNNLDPNVGSYFGHGGTNLGEVAWVDGTPLLGMHNLSFAPFQYYAHIGCPLGGCVSTSIAYPLFLNDGLTQQGTFGWNPALSRYEVTNVPLAFGQLHNGHLTSWAPSGGFALLNFSGNDTAGNEKGFMGQAQDGILYHLIPSGGQETWRWGGSGSNTGSLTSTNFDYPGLSIGGNPVCQLNGTNCPAGGGGATTPATTLLYKGNNTVNGVVAATPGTDYTTPAPTATQQIAQPAGTTFAAIEDNFIIDVEAAPSTCSAAPYGTHSRKIDCAIGYAKTQQSATSSAVLLQLGAGNYITCDGIVQPTSGTGGIMIRGAGMAVTTISADTTGGCAVAGNPLYQHTAGYEILEVSDLTFNPNGVATTCYDTTVTEAILWANTNCMANGNYGFGQFTATSDGTTGNFTGVTGTFPAVGNFVVPRFAVPGPPLTVTAVNSGAGTITVALPSVAGVTSGNFPAALTGGLYQFTTVDHIAGFGNPAILDFVEDSNYIIHNIISAPYTTNVLYATVSGTLTGSSVTALSCASLCGDYKADTAAQLHVFFNDPTHACTTLPVAHITSVSGGSPNTITGFTIEYGGSCTVMPYVGVAPEVEVPYGIKLALSDSTTTGWYVGAGKIGMYTVGGNTFHEHFHPTSTAVGFEDHGNTHWDSTEFDTLMQLGGMLWGTSPSVVTAANGVTGAHVLPGISSFYFANASTPMTFHGLEDMFTSTSPTGYNEFTNAAGVVTPCGTGWPALATILQNDKIKAAGIDCLPTLTVQTLTLQNALTLPNGSTATTQTAGDNTNKLATTAFVTGALTSSIQRVASGFCTGVFTSSTTIGIPGFGVALSTAACTGTRAATSGYMMNGSGTLSNLKMRCAATGVNTSSGVLTLNVTHAGTGSTFTPTGLTVTYGTSTANSVQADTTHTFAYSDGDLLTVAITTQATETLSTCNVSVNY